MKHLLKKDQKIYAVPKDIKGALSSSIKKQIGSFIEFEAKKEDLEYYSQNDTIEMFTVVDDGMLYFKPVVFEINETTNIIKVEFDREIFDLLQRREFTRVELDNEFKIKESENEFACKCLDISAGGMRFTTTAKLKTDEDYLVEFSLENCIPIQCFFRPVRAEKQKGKGAKYIVSGRFIALKNIDKIAIVQFCFKKQIENTNK